MLPALLTMVGLGVAAGLAAAFAARRSDGDRERRPGRVRPRRTCWDATRGRWINASAACRRSRWSRGSTRLRASAA